MRWTKKQQKKIKQKKVLTGPTQKSYHEAHSGLGGPLGVEGFRKAGPGKN